MTGETVKRNSFHYSRGHACGHKYKFKRATMSTVSKNKLNFVRISVYDYCSGVSRFKYSNDSGCDSTGGEF